MKTASIRLSDHFDLRKLILFSVSPICAMLFTSLYSIVDGYFVSNYVGATAFASLNLVLPIIMMVAAIGFMFGSGGSALVAFTLGMKDREKANRSFSLIVYAMMILGGIFGLIGFLFAVPISRLVGADDAMMPYCITYLRINMLGVVFFMMQQLFQSFLITAEKPKLGFRITVIAGCTNMFLDWLLVGTLRCGLAGAAWATVIAQMVGGIIPMIYFLVRRDGALCLGKTSFDAAVLIKACSNGVSEFLSNISASIVGFLYNLQLLRYAGESGVAAYGVIMYVSFLFVAVHIGFTMGVSPVISYHDGAGNRDELKSLYSKSLRLLLITNITMTLVAELTAVPLAQLYVGYQPDLCEMTTRALQIFSLAFLVMGFNIFASAFFTALNNGRVSAVLSVSRTLVLQLIMIYLLPALFGVDGLWTVVIAVEACCLIITVCCLRKYGSRYGYR